MRNPLVRALTLLGGAVLLMSAGMFAPMPRAGGFEPAPAPVSRTDRIIIKFRDPATARAQMLRPEGMGALSARAVTPLRHVRSMAGDADILALPARVSLAEARAIAERLSADPAVEYAEPDSIMRPMLLPNDPRFTNGDQWHYRPAVTAAGGANLPGAWDVSTGHSSVVVAVIDTGIVTHAEFTGRTVQGYDFVSADAAGVYLTANDGNGRDSNPADPGDWITAAEDAGTDSTGGFFAGCGESPSSWHGSHVAGTVGAASNNAVGVAGINWVSRILPVRVLGKCGGWTSDIAEGVRWAAGLAVSGVPANANPAKVINLSLGGAGPCSTTMQNAIDAVNAAGAVVVVAAGNEGLDLATDPGDPASCSGVVTVAAVGRNGERASYSNFGAVVEITAPGGDGATADRVLSTLNTGTLGPTASPAGDTYGYSRGTSMATPHVSGVVSLMLSVNPSLNSATALNAIQSSARSFPTGTVLDCTIGTCGAGIIDAAAVVGANSRLFRFSATSLSYPSTVVGVTTAPQTVTLTNTNTVSTTLTIATVTIGGTHAGDFAKSGDTCSSSAVPAGGSCQVDITFTPGTSGARTASLTIASNAAHAPHAVSLSGTGAGPVFSAPTTVSFTSPAVAVTSSPANVSITNSGDENLVIASATIVGTHAAEFAFNTNGCDGVTLTPATSCTMQIVFTPSAVGTRSAQVAVASNASTSPDGINLSGRTSGTVMPPPAPNSGGCFIATAAYGTPMAEEVRYLRALRDEVLLTSDLGRGVVDLYYRVSPALAERLRGREGLRRVVRIGLKPLVALSRWWVSDAGYAAQTADRP